MILRLFVVVLITISTAGCAAKVTMAEKRDPVFTLQSKNVIEKDLTEPH